MKTKNLLITQSKAYAHIFEVSRDARVSRISFPKFTGDVDLSYTHYPLVPYSLPEEITYNILFRLFYTYLRASLFSLAIDLLLLNKRFAFAVYRQIYGKYEPTRVVIMLSRLRSTILLVEAIYDDYLCEMNNELSDTPAIRLELKSIRTRPLAPWDFYPEIVIEEHSRIVAKNGPPQVYTTGPNFGDLVHVYGDTTEGVTVCTQIYHPIFTIILSNMAQALLPNEFDFWHNRYFKHFSKLLRTVFGSHAGIYFMVNPENNDDNPFITQSDTFYRF